MSKHYDVVIVGAGISGLSMAHYCLRQGLKTLILEKEQRAGGSMHSHRIDEGGVPFWIELGAHSCFNSYGNLLNIIEDLHLLGCIQARQRVSFRLLINGTLKSIPSQLRLSELLSALPRMWKLNKAGQSVAGYYGQIVGPHNYAAVLGPAFDAVICQHSADFPAELLFRAKRRRRDVIRSFTLPGGLQTIVDAIALEPGLELRTQQELREIAFAGGLFKLATGDGQLESNYLCLATPVDSAARLLRTSFAEVAECLARVPVVAVETVAVVIRREDVRLPAMAGLIARDDCFFSVVSRDSVAHPLYRGFTFHFKPGLQDHAGRLKRIQDVLGVRESQLQAIVSKHNRLPALRIGHQERVAEIDRRLSAVPLALTGNYFSGLSIEDCVARSLSEFSRLRDSDFGRDDGVFKPLRQPRPSPSDR
jgi:oxygen-dependent protoporphyrinogen oxidase